MQNIWIYVYLAKYIDFLCTIRRLGSRIFGRVQQQQQRTWLTFHPPSQSGPASLNLLPSLSTDDHDHGRHDPESSFSSWWSGWWIRSQLWTGPTGGLPQWARNQPWQYFMSHFHPPCSCASLERATWRNSCPVPLLPASFPFNTRIFNQLAQIWQNIHHTVDACKCAFELELPDCQNKIFL